MMELSNDYFLEIDDDMLVYLEQQGNLCVDEVRQSNEVNRERANKLLSLLLAGVGSSVMFILSHYGSHSVLHWVFVMLVFGWSAALVFVAMALSTHKKPIRGNSPERLYTTAYRDFGDSALAVLRRVELLNYTVLIDELMAVNQRLFKLIDRAIVTAIITPLIAILVFLVLLI